MSWRAIVLETAYQTSEQSMSTRLSVMLFIGIWVAVVAVADMNWPSHMGPQNVLVDSLLSLVP